MDYAQEFMHDEGLGLDDEVWLLDHSMPSYLPDTDNYWLLPVSDSAKEVNDSALEIMRDEIIRAYEDYHAVDCQSCHAENSGECDYVGDIAYIESLGDGDGKAWLEQYGRWVVRLDYPNNGYGELWELRKVTFRDMGLSE